MSATASQIWIDAKAAFKRRDYAIAAELLQGLAQDRMEIAGVEPGDVAVQLGVTLLRAGRTAEGVEALERAVALMPANARAHQKLGVGLARLGRDEAALVQLERAAGLAPLNAEYQWRLGEQLRRLGRAEDAQRAFARALEIDPGHALAAEGLQRLKRPPGGWPARLAALFRRRS